MSDTEISKRRLTLDDVVDIRTPMPATVINADSGETIETVTLLRYSGQQGEKSTFALKTEAGKFKVRSATQLGLTADSKFALILPDATA